MSERILMISAAGELGGAERSFCELIRALPRERIDVHVCVPPGCALTQALSGAVTIHEVEMQRFYRTLHPLEMAGRLQRMYRCARQIAQICAAEKIQILHANTDSAALIAWEASRQARLPFLWHCRDIRPMHGLARLLASRASAVIAISRAVEEHLLSEGVKEEKISRILNGIDISPFAPNDSAARREIRGELSIAPDAPLLLDVGALVPWKKHELFLETLAQVRQSIPETVGVIAGSDLFSQNKDYAQSLQARAAALDLDGRALKWLGQRPDVAALLSACDLLVAPSENEPFGRVLAEAGACGVPVVATRSGAKPEIVDENITGLLCEPTAEALATACITLLNDFPRRAEMGAQARRRAEWLFNIERVAVEFTALIAKSV